jgi:hypothetical protein
MRCEEKKRFLNRESAAFQLRNSQACVKASRRLSDKNKKRKRLTTEPYLCGQCGFWHLGSNRFMVVESKYNKIVDAEREAVTA